MTAAPPGSGAGAPAADQALRVLLLLSRHATPLPAGMVAHQLGLPRSTTYRLLGALAARGFVVHLAEERRFGLGLAAFELGSAYARQEPLQRLARPVVARLAMVTGHRAHLAVLHGRDVLYVVEERVADQPSLVSDVGVRLPATLAASGLAILAALPAAQVRALFGSVDAFVQRTGAGPGSPAALRTALRRARDRGWALEQGFVTPGLASVGCAVRDPTGHPVAAVAVTYPDEATAGAGPRAATVAAVRAGAREVSQRLRGRAS